MGQMTEEEIKKFPVSKTKLKYQIFSVLYLILVLPSFGAAASIVMMLGVPDIEFSKLKFFFFSQLGFTFALIICGVGGLSSSKSFVEVPSIGSRIFFWLPIFYFSFNVLLFILFFVF